MTSTIETPGQVKLKNIANAPNWQLRNVTRDFTKEKKISMSFQINSEGYEPEWFFLQVNVTREAKDASFYKPCDPGGNFSVSWSFVGETTGSMVLW
ncbi:hypothetical protein DCS_05721 [Drechmeria coniospora]|uniref:Uncharacterized protein n=1 Tax=Drechmeria coniospora TaxID=98403 RepID=A0A151GNK4_DRECN|nr:hypothetical protein DCS_05721 [Drechmeria coniospora]KYK58704.1 hypothetical protein DCS_05721 [Drechmeria coniospora]